MSARGCVLSILTPLLLTVAASAAEVHGVIAKVDPDRGEIILEGRGLRARGVTFTFTVDKDTRILFGHDPGKLSDLAPGKRIHITFEVHGDRAFALLIEAHGSPASAAAPAPAPAPAAPAAPADAITGTLQRLALTEREIVVIGPGPKGPETETTIAVPEAVRVVRGDKAVAFEDLKEGEQVAVTAEKRNGKLTATAIYAGGATPPAAGPAAPPAATTKAERLQKVMTIVGEVLRGLEQMRRNR
jgi:Cu/Ag efflux protein CusF